MARNVKWRASFKSLNGTSCTIDIYQNDWPSYIDPIQVTAAADPFFFEEDDSDDLLDDVLRYSTGYIRLVKQFDSGIASLDDIYPTEAFDRYVEVKYGNTVVFNGYIQVQDFSDELVPVPRVIELPVISPLGLMDQKIFANILPPTSKTLGELLNTALSGLYSYVYFPKNYGYPNPITMGMKILSTVVTPFNDDYHYTMNIASDNYVMKGESYAFLIEAICKAFGWIAHEIPGSLIFTAFDYEDQYYYYPVSRIGESGYGADADIPATAIDLTDYFTPADDHSNVTKLLPETGIEINYEGESDTKEFDFVHTYIPEQDAIITMPTYANEPDEVNSICNLHSIYNLHETSIQGVLSFDNNDLLNIGRGCCAWNGDKGVMISMSGAEHSGNQLFWLRFYFKKRGSQIYRVSYDMIGRQNGYLLQLAVSGSDVDEYYVYTTIDPTNTDYVEVKFNYRFDSNHPQLPSQAVIFISNIRLKILEDSEPYSEYRYKPAGDSDIIPEVYNPQPAISKSITMPISLYRNNDNLVGSSVRSNKITTYPYMFTQRKHFVGNFRFSAALTFPHVRLLSYMSKNWRIIAQRFNIWDDEYQLTMENSSILDS